MKAPRRPRTDSLTFALNAGRQGGKTLLWPAAVPAAGSPQEHALALKLFNLIVAERAPTDWSDFSLVIAARLAATQALAVRITGLIQAQGPVVLGGRNGATAVRNPMLDALTATQNIASQLQRQLGIGTPAVDRRQLSNAAKAFPDFAISDDDLLAR